MKNAAIVLFLLLTGCVADRVDTNYHGSDAGVLVYSAGNVGAPTGVFFFYRKIGQRSGVRGFGGDGAIRYNPGSIVERGPDYTGRESGWVAIQHLEPGEYEIYTWQQYGGGGYMEVIWSPKNDFSLRFTIRPGQTTYIGNFEGFQIQMGARFLFVISDKHERDMAIANKVEPGLPPITIAVPDVSSAGEPSLLSREPF